MWNKYKKNILIAVFSIIILIIIDISQALIFQNSPVLKIREHFDGGTFIEELLNNSLSYNQLKNSNSDIQI